MSRRLSLVAGELLVMVLIKTHRLSVELLENISRECLARSAETNSLPVETKHGGRVTKHKAQIVRHHDTGEIALVLKPVNKFVDVLFAGFVDARGRFVQ